MLPHYGMIINSSADISYGLLRWLHLSLMQHCVCLILFHPHKTLRKSCFPHTWIEKTATQNVLSVLSYRSHRRQSRGRTSPLHWLPHTHYLHVSANCSSGMRAAPVSPVWQPFQVSWGDMWPRVGLRWLFYLILRLPLPANLAACWFVCLFPVSSAVTEDCRLYYCLVHPVFW